jgi:hypothetical protein
MDIRRRIFESGYQLEMHKLVAKHRWVLRIANLVRRPAGGQAQHEADRKADLPRVDAIHQNIPVGKTTPAAYARRSRIWLAGL